jgi:hypothetical protein
MKVLDVLQETTKRIQHGQTSKSAIAVGLFLTSVLAGQAAL